MLLPPATKLDKLLLKVTNPRRVLCPFPSIKIIVLKLVESNNKNNNIITLSNLRSCFLKQIIHGRPENWASPI